MKLFNGLILVMTILITTNSLKIHYKLIQSHLELFRNHRVEKTLHQKFSKILHLDSQTSECMGCQTPVGDFFTWLMSNPEIVESATSNNPVSEEMATKIRNYLTDHPEIIDSCISQRGIEESTLDCLKRLNKEQKKKYYGWILEGIDFKNMFVKGTEIPPIGQSQIEELTQRAMNDPEIGPIFRTCKENSNPKKI